MLELLRAVGLGLIVLLPLANPLTTVALFLSLAKNMNTRERRKQSLQAAGYVFLVMTISWYAGQLVMDTFGISISGLRIAGGLIVSFLGFRMLFPNQTIDNNMKETTNIAFIPLAIPTTAGPGTIAMIISSASDAKDGIEGFHRWVISVTPVITFFFASLILWLCLRSSGTIMKWTGNSGIEAISRLMGFLLVCMGVQFAINGILETVRTLSCMNN